MREGKIPLVLFLIKTLPFPERSRLLKITLPNATEMKEVEEWGEEGATGSCYEAFLFYRDVNSFNNLRK